MPIDRNVAVTGGVTLNGRILPIGGLKEKLLAALRGKITKVLIPAKNAKDLSEIPKEVLENITIKPIATVEEAFKEALIGYKAFSDQDSSKNEVMSSVNEYNNEIIIESDTVA
jgi:ATP-dependent Lon protease